MANFICRYGSGSVCIFYSSWIYHKVSHFVPDVQTLEQKEKNITPGRVGTVLFFPKTSFDILKGKPAKWGKTTDYGQKEV